MQQRGKTLSDHVVSLAAHAKAIESVKSSLGGADEIQFDRSNLDHTAYGKELAAYTNGLLAIDNKYRAGLDEIKNKAVACLSSTTTDEAQAKKQQVEFDNAFKLLETAIQADIKALPEEAKATTAQNEIRKQLEDQLKKLEANKQHFNEELSRLDARLSAHLLALKAVHEMDRDGYLPGVMNRNKFAFRPRSYQPTPAEIAAMGNSAVLVDKNMAYKDMKRLQESGDEYYLDRYNNLYQYSKNGCRPVPPIKDENFAQLYASALELMRQKNPANCSVILEVPGIKGGKEDPRFVNETYIQKKLIPIMLEAHKRGIPITIDPELNNYFNGLKVKYEQAQAPGANIGLIDKMGLPSQSMISAIDKIYSLVTSPENAEKLKARAQAIGEMAPRMQKEIKDEVSKLEIKALYKAVAIESKNLLDAIQKKVPLDAKLKGIRDAVLGIDFEVNKNALAANPVDAKRINAELVTAINTNMEEIKKDMENVTKAQNLFTKQLEALQGKIAEEDQYRDENKLDEVHRNPFLLEHIKSLQTLVTEQQKKLAELDARAQIILQAAEERAVQTPGNPDVDGVVKTAKDRLQSIASAKALVDKQSGELSHYKGEREDEISAIEARESKGFKKH